jgi:PRTRC genetic system protein E
MFRELMPILEGRTLMLTLSRVDENLIRVCVIPQRTKEATGENALCTPLTVTGTADEDREFAVQLSGYTTAVVKFGSNLSAIEAASRRFFYLGLELPDLDGRMTPEQIRDALYQSISGDYNGIHRRTRSHGRRSEIQVHARPGAKG